MDIGSDLYFHILSQNCAGGGHPGPPEGVTTQNMEKNVLGHVTYQSRAHEKLYSNTYLLGSYLGSSSSGLHWERLEHPCSIRQLHPVSCTVHSQFRPECSCDI